MILRWINRLNRWLRTDSVTYVTKALHETQMVGTRYGRKWLLVRRKIARCGPWSRVTEYWEYSAIGWHEGFYPEA